MKVTALTLPFDPESGGFDNTALEAFQLTRDLLSVDVLGVAEGHREQGGQAGETDDDAAAEEEQCLGHEDGPGPGVRPVWAAKVARRWRSRVIELR